MSISDTPILAKLRTRMLWRQERQRVLAENAAATPKYRARDLAPPDFEHALRLLPSVSSAPIPIILRPAARAVATREGANPTARCAQAATPSATKTRCSARWTTTR
jgi:hypothetical protein